MYFHPAVSERRTFLKGAAASAVLATAAHAASDPGPVSEATTPLNILILGGTGFTGPEQVRYALARGHKVTLLNRNNRPDMFKDEVTHLVGDLGADVSALQGRDFDVVIDNPTTFPFWVRNAAQYLKGHTRHYIFISTISVYADNSVKGQDESAATLPMPAGVDPYTLAREHLAPQYYGPLKAFAEKEVETHYPGISTIIRPGLIVGPLDQSDRFTYWPVRIAKGGRVLAPNSPHDATQIIDSRDIAEWTIRMAEQRAFGTYNAMGPAQPLTMGGMLTGIKDALGSDAAFVWVPADFLRQHDVNGWINMPAWVPSEGPSGGLLTRNNARAMARGLTFRPLAVTARDTLAWHRTRPAEEQLRVENAGRAGITAAKEAEVLTAWAADRKTKPS
jgi:2'-hydroxyisoflavone reductase